MLKVFGITLTNGLSVSLHAQNVTTTCTQTLYDLRVLRAHGLCDSALQIIFTALHGMQSGLPMTILSVRPSVTRVYCDKTVERSVQIYIPYEGTFSLVF